MRAHVQAAVTERQIDAHTLKRLHLANARGASTQNGFKYAKACTCMHAS